MINEHNIASFATSAQLKDPDTKRLEAFLNLLKKDSPSIFESLDIQKATSAIQRLQQPNVSLSAADKGLRCVVALLVSTPEFDANAPFFLNAYATAYHTVLSEDRRFNTTKPDFRYTSSNCRIQDKKAEDALYSQALKTAKNAYAQGAADNIENAKSGIAYPAGMDKGHCDNLINHAFEKAKREYLCLQSFKADIVKTQKMLQNTGVTYSPFLMSQNVTVEPSNASVLSSPQTMAVASDLPSDDGKFSNNI